MAAQSDSDRAFDRLLDVLLLARKLLVEHHLRRLAMGDRFECLPFITLDYEAVASFPSDASQFGYLGFRKTQFDGPMPQMRNLYGSVIWLCSHRLCPTRQRK